MPLEHDLHKLTGLELFARFEPDALRLLAISAETQRLRAGDVLFRRNAASDGGYVLLSGSVALQSEDNGGPAERIVKPCALLGETALVAATRRPIGAMIREPSIVLKVTRGVFHEVLEQYPITAARVRALFRDRLLAFSRELTRGEA